MPINLPQTKICIRCGKPFETTVANQETCGGCPSSPKPPERKKMNNTVDEKICIDCKNPFKPSCNNQKRCPECMQKVTHKKKTAGPSVKIVKSPALFNSETLEALKALKSAGFLIIARKGTAEIIIG